jgi:hypothetical protein
MKGAKKSNTGRGVEKKFQQRKTKPEVGGKKGHAKRPTKAAPNKKRQLKNVDQTTSDEDDLEEDMDSDHDDERDEMNVEMDNYGSMKQ